MSVHIGAARGSYAGARERKSLGRGISNFITACTIVLGLAANPALSASTLPGGFAESLVTGGLSSATAMAFAPDGRLFVAEQGGRLRVVKQGALLATPFLTLRVDSRGERGLLGIAFDPDFATNQHIYVYYTATTPTVHNRVSRFTADGDVVVPGSEVVILDLNNLSSAENHNGGAMHFGPDGKLYIAVGENAAPSNAQTLGNLLGKMLRINPDGTVPTDNPFFSQAQGANRAIWALGLRNPFTFALDPGTARMFINDVGSSAWEEINDGIAGANYGWPATEGYTSDPRYHSPVSAYARNNGACAITGGAFYRPVTAQFPPEFIGDYFFSDYCGGWIRRLDPATKAVTNFATGISFPVDLKVGPDGSLYYLARGGGSIYRIAYTASSVPSISLHPADQTVAAGQSATFTVRASSSTPLSYQWQRGGIDIPGATSAGYTLASATPADNGEQFQVVVSNAFGSATSAPATLTVVGNSAPIATITWPPEGSLYRAGSTIYGAGTAKDAEDGALPASAFTWRVDFHHDDHIHPFIGDIRGITGGAFKIPTTGETSANVWYRIHLTVTDSAGLTHATFRDVYPRTATITLATRPAGLQVTLDGQPRNTPYTFVGVVGMRHTIGAPSPQTANGRTYYFSYWSDFGPAQHNIAIPGTTTRTYTAYYR